MIRAAMFLVGAALLGGCLRSTTFHCDTADDCSRGGAQGTCQPEGFCSFPDSDCPSGQRFGDLSGPLSNVCVGQQGNDGGIDVPGTTDTDGDGVPDATDNCPAIANADQGNEDGDHFGDVCDPCPPVADDNAPDGDGDGVADACDPRPAMSGDQIVLFEGFHAGLPATWMSTGTWTPDTDDLVATTTNTVFEIATTASTTKHETLSTSITVTSITAGANFSGIGVIDDQMIGTTSAVSCSAYRTTQFQPNLGVLVSDGTSTGNMTAPYAQAMAAGSTYTLQLRRDLGVFGCSAATTGGSASTALTTAVDNTPSYEGAYVLGATVRAHWLMVVSSP